MSPNERERAYARKRYQDWQERQARASQKRRKQRNALLAALAALAVVAVVVGIAVILGGDDKKSDTVAAPSGSPSAIASPTGSASPSGSGTPSPSPCPSPTRTPPANPQKWSTAPDPSLAQGKTFTVTFKTNCGDIVAELDGTKAPKAVASTVFLARSGFYDGVICHRLTTTGIYVLQCGDPLGSGIGGPGYTYGPVENAPADGVYKAGTIAMARQGENGSSQGSQFFFVYKDSKIPNDNAGGYTVLGTVTSGLDVVSKVAQGGISQGAGDGLPAIPIAFNSVAVKGD